MTDTVARNSETKVRALTLRTHGSSGKKVGATPARGEREKLAPYWSWVGVPSHVSPSRPVRFVGQAVVAGTLFGAVVYVGLEAAWHAVTASWYAGQPPMSSVLYDANGALVWTLDYLSAGQFHPDWAADYVEQISQWGGLCRLALGVGSLAISAAAGIWGAVGVAKTVIPNVRHIKGPRLLEGADAWAAIRKIAVRRAKGELWPVFALPLDGPRGVWLHKAIWSEGALLVGAPGSGKTTILMPLVAALVQWLPCGAKAWVWDSKGEYTRRFSKSRGVGILSPFDRRSVVWSICSDIRTRTDCKILAGVLAEGVSGGGDKFWPTAAATVIQAVLEHVIEATQGCWGFDTIAEMFAMDRQTLLATLLASGHKEVNYFLGGVGTTPDSVLATVGACVALFKNLGQAWPYYPSRPAEECFSVRDWCLDNYGALDGPKGPRMLLIKPDDDMDTVGTMLAIMTNLAAQIITGPRLSDDQDGRCLAFVFDELASLGGHKIDVERLVSQGRSRGSVPLLGFQDFSQLSQIYGEEGMKSLQSMIGNPIYCRSSIGETRNRLAELIGKRTVAVQPHGLGDKRPAMEEQWDVVTPDYLSNGLGRVDRPKSATYPAGVAVRVLVPTKTGDFCALEIAAQNFPIVAGAYKQAEWVGRWEPAEKPVAVEIPADEKAHRLADFAAMPALEPDPVLIPGEPMAVQPLDKNPEPLANRDWSLDR